MQEQSIDQKIKEIDVFLSSVKEKLQSVIKCNLPNRNPIRVLEAGCGSTTHIWIDPRWQLTGIDISERQLSNNTLLRRKILGNIETHRWEEDSFDLVICWDVIEHLPNPDNALKNLFAAISTGGLLVLAFPHLLSIKGLVAKITPFWLTILFYRHIIGDKRGKNDMDQFPTYMRFAILPGKIITLAEIYGLEVRYRNVYQGPVQSYLRAMSRLSNAAFALAGICGKTLTRGHFDPNLTDCILVFKKS